MNATATPTDLQHYYYYLTASECYGYPRRLTTLYYYLTASECYGYPRRLTTLLLSREHPDYP